MAKFFYNAAFFPYVRIYGNILLKDEFFNGTIEIEDEEIVGIWRNKENYDLKGTVIPTFVNMHTHIGDYYYGEEINLPLKDVVAPGGLKFKILNDENNVKKGMKEAVRIMESCGTSHFVDFREGGKRGVDILCETLKGEKIKGVILGRNGLWENADGISISSISDISYKKARYLSEIAHKHGKIFALHALENGREDIDKIIALHPKFIVHFLDSTDEDIRKLAEKKIPVVLTPRANVFWGKIPNIPKLIKSGILVALGTDNGMISSPCMFREMEFAYRISRIYGKVAAEDIIKMATVRGREIMGIDDNFLGGHARLIIFRTIMTPYEILTRAGVQDIFKVLI